MLLVLLLSCAQAEAPVLVAPPSTPPIAEPAPSLGPPFPYHYAPLDLDGKKASFGQWTGKPVMVNLWATWCGPCIEELPALVALNGKWKDRGLVMIGVAIEDFPPKVKATAEARGMDWVLLQDGAANASRVFKAENMPVTLLYAPDGRLLFRHDGVLKADDAALIAALELAVR